MFAIFNYAIIAYSFFFLRETKGKSLEEMEVVFGTVKKLKSRSSTPEEGRGGLLERNSAESGPEGERAKVI